MNNIGDLLTAREVAEKIGRTPRDVSRLVKSGELLPAFRAPGLRGAMFFTHAEVEHYRAMRELQTAGKATK